MLVPKILLNEFLPKILNGFGFGLGMGVAFKILDKKPGFAKEKSQQ